MFRLYTAKILPNLIRSRGILFQLEEHFENDLQRDITRIGRSVTVKDKPFQRAFALSHAPLRRNLFEKTENVTA